MIDMLLSFNQLNFILNITTLTEYINNNAFFSCRDDFEELQDAIDDSGMAVRFEHTPAGCSRGNQIAEDLAKCAYQDSGMSFLLDKHQIKFL